MPAFIHYASVKTPVKSVISLTKFLFTGIKDENSRDLELDEKNKDPKTRLFHKCLMNQFILESIFKHLKTKDLKRCRLVCKRWKKCSEKDFAATTILKLNWMPTPYKLRDLKDYKAVVKKSEKCIGCEDDILGIPVVNLGLAFAGEELMAWQYPGIIRPLIEKSGPLIQSLTIHDVNMGFKGWIEEICVGMPNLERLDLKLVRLGGFYYCIQGDMRTIEKEMKKLKLELMWFLSALKKKGELKKLKWLAVTGNDKCWSNYLLIELIKLCKPSVLKGISMGIFSVNEMSNCLREIQNSYNEGTGLEELRLGEAGRRFERGVTEKEVRCLGEVFILPMFEGLKVLELNMPVQAEEWRHILETGNLCNLTLVKATVIIKPDWKGERLRPPNAEEIAELDYLCWIPGSYDCERLRKLDLVIILSISNRVLDCYGEALAIGSGRVVGNLESLAVGFNYSSCNTSGYDTNVDITEGFESVFPSLKSLTITTSVRESLMDKWKEHMPDTLTHLVVSHWLRCAPWSHRYGPFRLPSLPGLKELQLMGDVRCLKDGDNLKNYWKLRKLEQIGNGEFNPDISWEEQFLIRTMVKNEKVWVWNPGCNWSRAYAYLKSV